MSVDRSREHLDTESYGSITTALLHARRVAEDLKATTKGQLVVPADELDFLTRRLVDLVDACLDAVEAGMRQ